MNTRELDLLASLASDYFMHVRYASRLIPVVILSGLFWLFILFALLFADYFTRGWLRVEVESGAWTSMARADGAAPGDLGEVERGPIRGITALGSEASLITVGASLLRLDYPERAPARVSRLLSGLASAVDPIVRDAFFKALEPAALEVSAEALRRLEESSQAADRHWRFSLERSRNEAEKARRQYDQVEPENRLVARELERSWEARLKEAKRLEEEFSHWKKERSQGWREEKILEPLCANVSETLATQTMTARSPARSP